MTQKRLNELMVKAQEDNKEIFEVLREGKRRSVRTFSKQAVKDLGSPNDYSMRKSLTKALIN